MNGRPCERTQPTMVHKGQSQATRPAQNSLLLEEVRGYFTSGLNGKWELNLLTGFVCGLVKTNIWANEGSSTQFDLFFRNDTVALEWNNMFRLSDEMVQNAKLHRSESFLVFSINIHFGIWVWLKSKAEQWHKPACCPISRQFIVRSAVFFTAGKRAIYTLGLA